MLYQSRSSKRLNEADFELKMAAPPSAKLQAILAEANAIRVKTAIAQQELEKHVRDHA